MAPLVVIVGETGSGKSALGLALAERLNGEIIAADSWTVYRGFDIGTAKPSQQAQARVRHHLLDVADPAAGFSAPQFQGLARTAIKDIANRGKLAIMVGGTGLYIDSLLFDYQFLPVPSPEIRQSYTALSLAELQDLTVKFGYDTTEVDLRNKRRLIRLLENEGAAPTRHELRSNTLLLGVSIARDDLRSRIAARVDAMLANGLGLEVKRLAATYGWEAEPMKGIGYREWREYFNGSQDVARTRERIISATMNLAKRQRTWFKRNSGIQWLTSEDKLAQAVDLTTTFLNK